MVLIFSSKKLCVVCAAKILVKRHLQRTAKVITTRNYFKRVYYTRSNGLACSFIWGVLERGTWLSAPHPIIIIILIIQRAETISSCSQITYTHTSCVIAHTNTRASEQNSCDDAYAPGSFARTASQL
jgi:lipoprotein signal peptidase